MLTNNIFLMYYLGHLDMLATALNVTGDSAAALIISEKENILDKKIYNKKFNN